MALYAELDSDKRVLSVVVCDSLEWLQERLGGTWVETTDADPNQQYAGPGMHDGETIAPMRFVPPWVQPTHAENAYEQGAWVWHGGQVWENLTPANVWEPGVSGWRDPLNEWPEWVQPTGAHDAYNIGDKVTFAGKRYISKINVNTWSPTAYPAGWELQLGLDEEAPQATFDRLRLSLGN